MASMRDKERTYLKIKDQRLKRLINNYTEACVELTWLGDTLAGFTRRNPATASGGEGTAGNLSQ